MDPEAPDKLDSLSWALNDAAIEFCVAIQKGTQGTLKPQSEASDSGRTKASSVNSQHQFGDIGADGEHSVWESPARE